MHVALDLDDCILDFTGGIRTAIKKEFVVEVPPFEEWEIRKILDPIIGVSWWKWMRRRSWLWSTFPAIEGAVGTIEQLRNDGHYLEIVTSKPEWAEANVWQWLGKWRLPVQRVTIIGQDSCKADATDAAVLVDDKPENCLDFIRDRRTAILFDRSHNRNLLSIGNQALVRAKGWPQVRELVNQMEAGVA